jgi:hypothetical protein
MYITLTNATPAHRGSKISINQECIATVHNSMVTREDGIMEQITFVFCPPHGTWEVSETLEEVVAILNKLA